MESGCKPLDPLAIHILHSLARPGNKRKIFLSVSLLWALGPPTLLYSNNPRGLVGVLTGEETEAQRGSITQAGTEASGPLVCWVGQKFHLVNE